jgi:hypothetical protein
LATVAACAGAVDAGARPADARLAAIYGAVILAVGGEHPVGEEPPVVFVVPRSDAKAIPLPVQAAVVDELDGEVSVRFVDEDDEAIDGSVDGRPVKEGFLLRLGPVAPTGDPVEVIVDRYRSVADQESFELSARSDGQRWSARLIDSGPPASG